MAQTYADFIDVQRLTGSINRDTIGVQDKLRQGFQDLMVETSALASLTGKNRNEILQRQMASLKDPRVAAATLRMRESGLGDQANAAESIVKQFAMGAEEFGQFGTTLSTALAEELSTTKDNIEQFDIRDTLVQVDPELQNILDQHAPAFLDGINDAVRTGQVEGGNLSTFVFNEFIKMKDSLLTQDVFQGASGASNTYIQKVKELTNSAILAEQNLGNLVGMTDEELAKFERKTKKNLGEAGTAVVAVNDLVTTFLEVQNALTYPLNKSADLAASLSTYLRKAMDRLKSSEEKEEGEIASTATKQGEYFDQSQQIAEEQGITPEELRKSDPLFDSSGMGADEILPFDPAAIEAAIQQGMTKEVIMSPTLGREIIVLKDRGDPILKFEARKDGGAVVRGETYLVGEQGPEFIEAGMAGNVTSFEKTTEQIRERGKVLSGMIDSLMGIEKTKSGNGVNLLGIQVNNQLNLPEMSGGNINLSGMVNQQTYNMENMMGSNNDTGTSGMISPKSAQTPSIRNELDTQTTKTTERKSSVDIDNIMSEYNQLKKNQLEVVKRFKTLMKSATKSGISGGHTPLIQ